MFSTVKQSKFSHIFYMCKSSFFEINANVRGMSISYIFVFSRVDFMVFLMTFRHAKKHTFLYQIDTRTEITIKKPQISAVFNPSWICC